MLSMPPAIITSQVPARMLSVANIIAFMPEPQTLLMVVQPTEKGMPAPMVAWRAGACPSPAGKTQPIRAEQGRSGVIPAASIAALIAMLPSCVAVWLLKLPWKLPIGVRLAEAITTVLSVTYIISLGCLFK